MFAQDYDNNEIRGKDQLDPTFKTPICYNIWKGLNTVTDMQKNTSYSQKFFIVAVIQTFIIMVAIGLLYWWQLSVTDVLVDKNVSTIQSLQKQLVNFEQQLKAIKAKTSF